MKSKNTKFYFIPLFLLLSFFVFSSEKVLAVNICYDPESPELTGICQTFSCSAGTTLIKNSNCSENWFDTTCCTTSNNQNIEGRILCGNGNVGTCQAVGSTCSPVGTSEIDDTGDTCNFYQKCCGTIAIAKTSTAPSGTANTVKTPTTSVPINKTASTSPSTSATAQTFGTQCTGGIVNGVETNCSHSNDATILEKQCKPLLGSGSCGSMPDYLSALSEKCKFIKYSSGHDVDCDLIAKNGIYGTQASKFANFLITTLNDSNLSSNFPSSSSGNPDVSARTQGSGSSMSPGVINMPTGFGLPDPTGGIKEILTNLLKWFLGIVGIVAMIAFVVSGVQYFLVSTDEKMATTAKKNMTFAIIGIITALSGFVIIKAIDTALNAKGLF